MPATSKAQFRLMQAVADGDTKLPGLTKEKAAEFISGQTAQGLPEKVVGKALGRLVGRVKRAKSKRFRIGG